ncbi:MULTISPECIES: flagellar hook-basal body protein [unclassified Oceanispirochaeta]|uniref:flagellar hook-basal body protein n=1 Tax=unclassified Oceanispirochaeta TaxID=2635722 RepID=UPI000E09DF8F|nr:MULTISPECIES: flagellar hook-basal body protein [unclassified Oceanispirochaeta]MBF9018593.1 flagellar hook-basal body protein [Oceanispirochaeta sp. M2]NPD75048.1 flagellar hook-basal body protein [Oceanispirochaeta sp. M1]RDG29119.1 flagellar hook-basal body protein [Oceanispirochaeta sp. M1]
MIRGLYTAASGMQAQQHRLNALSNNLANVDLTGYKKDTSIHKAFPEMMIRRFNDDGVHQFPIGSVDTAPIVGKLGMGVEYNESFTVFDQGAMKETSNPFDMALDGDGFFTIQTNDGERFTRNGSFILGKEGYLLTKEGYPVLGEEGPVQIKLNNFTIDKKGRIFQNGELSDNPQRLVSMQENDWAGSELVDTLKVVQFEGNGNRFLKKMGSSMWTDTPESGAAFMTDIKERPTVLQGFLEASNVNSVTEMVNMIEVNRAYEANQKMISTQDSLLGKLINQAAKY